ncbi:hypothetical protein L9F63_025985, partial [Diploptera punctata]
KTRFTKPLTENDTVIVERGMKTLIIDSSIERNDGFSEYLKDKKSVAIHVQCLCINCQGQSCSNVESNGTDEDLYDFNEETTDTFFSEQLTNIQQEEEQLEEDITLAVEFEDYQSD